MAVQRAPFYQRTGSEATGDLPLWNGSSGRYSRLAKGANDTQLGVGPSSGNVGYQRSPIYRPRDLSNWLGFTLDPRDNFAGSPLSSAAVAGTLILSAVPIQEQCSIATLQYYVTSAGVTLTSNQNFMAVFQNSTLVGVTADQTTNWGSTGAKSASLVSGPFTVQQGFIEVGMWWNGTTAPSLLRGVTGAIAGAATNLGTSGTGLRFSMANTGLTTTAPGTITTRTAGVIPFIIGVS